MYLRIIVHANEHMGQRIAYARMNGVVPPWSKAASRALTPPRGGITPELPPYAPSSRRDLLPDIKATIVTAIAVSSHEAGGTTTKTNAVLPLGGPKATTP